MSLIQQNVCVRARLPVCVFVCVLGEKVTGGAKPDSGLSV